MHLFKRSTITSLFIVFSMISVQAFAATSRNDFATIQASQGGGEWVIDPSVNYQSIQLKLSRNCSNITNCTSFDKVSVFNGQPYTGQLEDGGYYYELVVTPALSPSVKAELQGLRTASQGKVKNSTVDTLRIQGSVPKRQVQSGYFTISSGELVSGLDVERKEKNYENIK